MVSNISASVHSKTAFSSPLILLHRPITSQCSSSSYISGMYLTIIKKVKQSRERSAQALRVPGGWGSQISRQSAHENGKVDSSTHRQPLPPRKYSRYSFSVRDWVKPGAIVRPEGLFMSIKNSNDITGNRIRDRQAWSAVPQPTAPPRAPYLTIIIIIIIIITNLYFKYFSTNTYNTIKQKLLGLQWLTTRVPPLPILNLRQSSL